MNFECFIDVNGLKIRYKRAGRGVPVVLIHGAGTGGIEDWEFAVFDKIAQTNDVIAFDRPGIGKSERMEGAENPSVQAAALKEACKILGVKRPIVIGHSYGGIVALAWALLDPKGVAGIMPVSAVSMPMEQKVEAILRLIARPRLGPVVAKIVCSVLRKKATADSVKKAFNPVGAPKGYMEHIGHTLFTDPIELRNIAREISALKIYLPDLSKNYPKLKIPVEILHGTVDLNLPAEEHSALLAKIIPDAHYTQLEGIGHMPHYHAVDKILEALARLTEQAA